MYNLLIKGYDLYNFETNTYCFCFNDEGSIASYKIGSQKANRLKNKAKAIKERWSAFLGPGGYIMDSARYKHDYRDEYGNNDVDDAKNWCNEQFAGIWEIVGTPLQAERISL